MPFTTLQDRALQIPRQAVPGAQYERVKFQLGEIRTILPPVGTEIINCQGMDIGPEGKKLQITKELVALIQAGFIRIAVDMVNPEAHKHSAPSSPSTRSMEGDVTASHADAPTAVSSLTSEGVVNASSDFLSVEELKSCQDREKLRLYVKSISGYDNEKTHIEGLRDHAIKLWNEAHA